MPHFWNPPINCGCVKPILEFDNYQSLGGTSLKGSKCCQICCVGRADRQEFPPRSREYGCRQKGRERVCVRLFADMLTARLILTTDKCGEKAASSTGKVTDVTWSSFHLNFRRATCQDACCLQVLPVQIGCEWGLFPLFRGCTFVFIVITHQRMNQTKRIVTQRTHQRIKLWLSVSWHKTYQKMNQTLSKLWPKDTPKNEPYS